MLARTCTKHCNLSSPPYSWVEQVVLDHFRANCCGDEAGRIIVPMPNMTDAVPPGELKSMTIQTFLAGVLTKVKGKFDHLLTY